MLSEKNNVVKERVINGYICPSCKCAMGFVENNFCMHCGASLIFENIVDVNNLSKDKNLVQVVRCKDCVYYDTVTFRGNDMHYGYCANLHDDVVGTRNRFELDFCSYGKRKEK